MASIGTARAAGPVFVARRRARLGSLVGLVGLMGMGASLGCGDSQAGAARPIPGCEGYSYEPCDILSNACQRELFALVACVRGDVGASGPPPVRVLDEARAIELLSGAESPSMADAADAMADPSLGERAFRAQVRALELLGLLGRGQIEDESDVLDATVSRSFAFYRVSTREVVIIDRGAPLADLDANLVLAHELVHAQRDARQNLSAFGADVAQSSDGALAVTSLVEGEAELYRYLLGFAYRGVDLRWIDYPAFFRDLAGAGSQATLEAGSPALTASSIFPYTFGTRYVGASWLDGGRAAIEARYRAPPRTSWEVLALGTPGETPAGVRFEQAPAALEGYTLVQDDVAGAWMTAAALAGLAEPARGQAALSALAGRWRGDHLWIYDSAGDSAVAALWVIEWADAEAAALFTTLGADLAGEGAVLDIEVRGASSRVVAAERAEDVAAWRERFDDAVP